ncbi:DUF302 domain-containing protein [Kitasatospora sp. GP82]|uniref:DUF302 domain-containing protein n=1 Tax=Kitasatospora sp. GP82 TaxID=3035089 RepID=UPI002474D70C|nr:DUF302 domain-containing protein [Kitasatospora sp. GP82]MDH6126499.1 uncharacterized protein (DUF302 family) [Kitasatospora sp. GP82]
MSGPPPATPAGTRPTAGVVHKRSPYPVGETVERLTTAVRAAGARVFSLIDHSGEAEDVGLVLRDTKLLIFGNPLGGTPAMVAAPLSAIDLPLKVLVWQDDAGAAWMSYLDPAWLAARHALTADLAAPLSAVDTLTDHVAARPGD